MATATTTTTNNAPAPAPAPNVWDMQVPSSTGSGDYVLCPPGNHPATIIGLFDIGHQDETDMKGQPKETRKLVLVFELKKKRPDGKPFVLPREYTWSLGEKANFYKDVVNVTGIKFKEGEKFNPLSLMGQSVMVSVTNTGAGEKVYHNVSGVAQYPEGFPDPEPTLHPVSWSVLTGEPFPGGLDWLPFVYGKSIPEKATESREGRGASAPAPSRRAPAVLSGDDSDTPF